MDRVGDERQRAPVERLTDQIRVHVDDLVAEPGAGGGDTVVRLVWVQHVHLTG
jgi:hypothetical protein